MIKVVQYGCGKMSKYTMRYVMENGYELVGAIDINPAVIGKDVSEVIECDNVGVKISPVSEAENLLKEVKPDICIITTMSLMNDVKDALLLCARLGINAITTCEEAFYPFNSSPVLTEKIDKLAKENNCKNIKILGYVNNVYEYMYASDLVVTKPGGLTVTECLYLHKPMLIINRNAGQEKGNYKYLVKNKFAIKTSHPYKFAKYLKEIANNDKILKNMQKALKKYGQKHALDDLFNLIMK